MDPDSVDTNSIGDSALFARMEQGVREGVFPGGVLLVQQCGQLFHQSAHGTTSCFPPMAPVTLDTVFDLASLTKVVCTTTLIARMVDKNELSLDDPVCRFLPAFVGNDREKITIAHLLDHSSGLTAWRAYYEEVASLGGGCLLGTLRGRSAVRDMVIRELPEAPVGSRALYSDLGFILLDWVLETVTGQPLDLQFAQGIAKPLQAQNLFFIDLKNRDLALRARRARSFAATERCPWRGRILQGEVHDDNTYAMGGVSGHAGLFGTATDVLRVGSMWIDSYSGSGNFLSPAVVKRFWRKSLLQDSTRALGFDTKSKTDSQAGTRFGDSTVGHLGYTGTSLWIDPKRELVAILLTNRVHPTRDNESIKQFRPLLHDLVIETLERT